MSEECSVFIVQLFVLKVELLPLLISSTSFVWLNKPKERNEQLKPKYNEWTNGSVDSQLRLSLTFNTNQPSQGTSLSAYEL